MNTKESRLGPDRPGDPDQIVKTIRILLLLAVVVTLSGCSTMLSPPSLATTPPPAGDDWNSYDAIQQRRANQKIINSDKL